MTQRSGAAHDLVRALQARMARAVVGQDDLISRLVIGLLANGHILVEGLPGLAKTRAVKALAANLHASFSRIQFTPDLLPSDITGTEIYYDAGGHGEFRFQPGPVFANIVLADEINRAPAKVQAALLEAMEERQVTAAGRPHPLPRLFMVLATQNPIEHEGTYPLPEAQMDRFLMHVSVTYPSIDAELEILRLVRGEEEGESISQSDAEAGDAEAGDTLPQDAVFLAREDIGRVHVSGAIERYIVDLVGATRQPGACPDIARWLQAGASPRGSLALDRCARAHAWLAGRDHVVPEDVRAIVHDALRHRLILSYEARAEGVSADRVIDLLVESVALP